MLANGCKTDNHYSIIRVVATYPENDDKIDLETRASRPVNHDLAYIIACGLLYDSSWTPGSLKNVEIFLDGDSLFRFDSL